MKLHEGKRAFSFDFFVKLAETAMKCSSGFESHIFGHFYILLCWFMMGRSSSVASIMWSHVEWSGDALTVILPKHKSNQSGENEIPKHIYAVPNNPFICPILSLAIFVLSKGLYLNSIFRLFRSHFE